MVVMKISYIVNARIPTEKAHGYQICKMCEEFANSGQSVELIFSSRKNSIQKTLFDFYNLKNNFTVKQINFFDFINREKYFFNKGYLLQNIFFLFKLLFVAPEKDSIIYTRNADIAWLYKKRGYTVFFEAHYWPSSKGWLYRNLIANVDGIICNSSGTMKKHQQNGLKHVMVAQNGVDTEDFDIQKTRQELRIDLSLPLDKKIVMYVGHLYGWKGVDTVIAAAKHLRDRQDIAFVLIGGTDMDLEKYNDITVEEKLDNVSLLGHKDKKFIPSYQKSADILLLPNTPSSTESIEYTSPIKMFEYMASGTAIIASNLPSITEILNNDCAFLYKAGNDKDLADKVAFVLTNRSIASNKASVALYLSKNYTWRNRAQKIIAFIGGADL